MEQMLEQLKRRIEGNRKATSRAADIFMSMVDRNLLRQLRINTQEVLETDQLEQELARQGSSSDRYNWKVIGGDIQRENC